MVQGLTFPKFIWNHPKRNPLSISTSIPCKIKSQFVVTLSFFNHPLSPNLDGEIVLPHLQLFENQNIRDE